MLNSGVSHVDNIDFLTVVRNGNATRLIELAPPISRANAFEQAERSGIRGDAVGKLSGETNGHFFRFRGGPEFPEEQEAHAILPTRRHHNAAEDVAKIWGQ